MAQISKGDTFANGEQVTGPRLNQLVDASFLLQGSITEQSPLTASTLAVDDQILISDTSASSLKRATIADVLGSSLPITASSVTATSLISTALNGTANNDVVVTPYDGANVSGKSVTTSDGFTATVTSTAHGLSNGMVLDIVAANGALTGTYTILVTSADTFTYRLSPTTTAASSTCSYIKKATQRVIGNISVSGSNNVIGNQVIGGNLRVIGSTTLSGVLTIADAATVTGTLVVPTPTLGGHATTKTYVDGTVVKAGNGYMTLPNGIIMQWGSIGAIASGGTVTVTLPIAFPSANTSVVVSTASAAAYLAVTSKTTTNFAVRSSNAASGDAYWMAIGY